MNNTLKLALFCLLILTLNACQYFNKKEKQIDTEGYFEGEINISESRGLYGSLFKVHTTYSISENQLKREQKLGGLYSMLDNYAGLIIDLNKDSVTLYYNDKIMDKHIKHTMSIEQYKSKIKTDPFPKVIPSPVDQTFNLFTEYTKINHVTDSAKINGFISDYTLYNDNTNIFKQEVFDSKHIKIKRSLLEMTFMNLPDNINFPLQSNLKTRLSDISNDSIISGKQTRAIDHFIRSVFAGKDTLSNKQSTDLEKLANSKLVQLGLDILKKGVDLNLHITSELSDIDFIPLSLTDFSLPSGDFSEIEDFDEFLNELPNSSGDFDD